MRGPLALLLAHPYWSPGCGGGSGGGPVRFLVFGAPEELHAFRRVDALRARAGPDVQLVEASDRKDLLARLSTSVAGGTPPDLFLMNYRFYGQFAAKGVLEPLDDGSTAPTPRGRDYYPVALDAFRWRRRAALPAAERLEPRRLLQPRPVPAGTACRSRRPAGPGTNWSAPRPR